MIAIIAAHADNNVIGINNALPWHIPKDLKHFKAVTMQHPVIMGRRTYESILATLGKPLPGRRNIVVTSSKINNVETCSSLEAAIKMTNGQDTFIIGGAQLYKAALDADVVDTMFITKVHASYDGDAFFPDYNLQDWEIAELQQDSDDHNTFDFITTIRRR